MTDLETMLALQTQDEILFKKEAELKSLPLQVKQVQAILTGHKESLQHLVEEIKKAGMLIHQLEADVESCRQQILKYREQQYQIKSNVEYRALEAEIGRVEQNIERLEEKGIEQMERVEQLTQEHQKRAKDFAKEEQRAAEELSLLDERAGNLKAERDAAKKSRTELAALLPGGHLERYERILSRVQTNALVPVKRGEKSESGEKYACGGCHMNLPPHIVNDTRRSDTLTTCLFCGRLLYWPH